jgi:hypothetical protein
MDERFRGKGIWIGLAALALIFLCVMLVGFAAVATLAPRLGPAYGVVPQVQPPAGGGGEAVPAPYSGYAPIRGYWGPFGLVGWGIGLIFKLLFFGLLLLLLFRLVRHLFWGPRHWGYRSWGPPWGGQPPEGKEGEGAPQAARGPWAWHHHPKHWSGRWGPPPWWGSEPGESAGAGEAGGAEADAAGSGYTGPQE